MLSYCKFRKLTKSIENKGSTKENIGIPLSVTHSRALPNLKRYTNKTLAHITGESKL